MNNNLEDVKKLNKESHNALLSNTSNSNTSSISNMSNMISMSSMFDLDSNTYSASLEEVKKLNTKSAANKNNSDS